jgi:hypothetical protein
VTSLADLGLQVSLPEVDAALHREFDRLFGPTQSLGDLAAVIGTQTDVAPPGL